MWVALFLTAKETKTKSCNCPLPKKTALQKTAASQFLGMTRDFSVFTQKYTVHILFFFFNKINVICHHNLFFREENFCSRSQGQFDLCLFQNQLEHLEVHRSCIAEAWLGEF